jgi:hypothetical protein
LPKCIAAFLVCTECSFTSGVVSTDLSDEAQPTRARVVTASTNLIAAFCICACRSNASGVPEVELLAEAFWAKMKATCPYWVAAFTKCTHCVLASVVFNPDLVDETRRTSECTTTCDFITAFCRSTVRSKAIKLSHISFGCVELWAFKILT